jgi:hypothetical protein
MKAWLTEAIIAKLEDDIDAREGLAEIGDTEGTISLKEYIGSKKG